MIKSIRNHDFKYFFAFFHTEWDSTSGLSLITTKLIGMFIRNMLSAAYMITLIGPVWSRTVFQTKTRGTRKTLAQSQILMLNCHLE